MWKTPRAIKELIEEYNRLSDEDKGLLEKTSLTRLCYSYAKNEDREEREKRNADRNAKLREIAEREFVPFTYWDVLFELPGKQTYAIEVIDYEFTDGNRFVSAHDKYGILIVAEDAIMLRATEVIVDSIDRLPDWCPLFKCEFGTYRTSPQWVKESANAND